GPPTECGGLAEPATMSRPRPAVIVHYHEIGLKRGNRPLFLRHLAKNLGRATSDLGAVRVRQLSGRILLDLDDHPAPGRVRDRVLRVCGVASTALATPHTRRTRS